MAIRDWFSRTKPDAAPQQVVQVYRPAPHKQRSYVAAAQTARFADFTGSGNSADTELIAALPTLRNKARALERNSGMMRRYLMLLQQNVVGEHGARFQCRIRRGDGKQDKTLNDAIEKEWVSFWAAPTVDRKMSGVDLLNQAIASRYRDGEVFWEIVSNASYPHGVLINPIEADMIDDSLTTMNIATGNQIRMGVEIAPSGEHVAYWVFNVHPGDMMPISGRPTERHRRLTADRVIHWYDAARPGQTRGEPPSVAALNPIKMLDGYREAETVMRRVKASIMGFFKRALPTPDGITKLADEFQENDDREPLEMTAVPGLMTELPAGMDFAEFNPGGSISDFDKADAAFAKHVAISLGISDMSLAMNVAGVSYSSGRTITMEDRQFYRTVQAALSRRLLAPVVMSWVKHRMLTTRIASSRFALIPDNFMFRMAGWESIDPQKEYRANQIGLETGQITLGQIAASRGIDPTDALTDLRDEIEAMTDMGLTHPYVAAMSKQMGAVPPSDDVAPDDDAPDDEDGAGNDTIDGGVDD